MIGSRHPGRLQLVGARAAPAQLIQSTASSVTSNQHNASAKLVSASVISLRFKQEQRVGTLIESGSRRLTNQFKSIKTQEALRSRVSYSRRATDERKPHQSSLHAPMTQVQEQEAEEKEKRRSTSGGGSGGGYGVSGRIRRGLVSPDGARHEWQVIRTRRKQKVNLSKQVERLTIDIASGRTQKRRRGGSQKVKHQIGGQRQHISTVYHLDQNHQRRRRQRRHHSSSALQWDKRNCTSSGHHRQETRRTISQSNNAKQHQHQDACGRPKMRCMSANNFDSSLRSCTLLTGRQLKQRPLIDYQSATSLSSSSSNSSSSMRSLRDGPFRTQSSQASAVSSSLSFIQFSSSAPRAAATRHSSASSNQHHHHHSPRESLKMDWFHDGGERSSSAERTPAHPTRKRSAATHFHEAAFSHRLTWRTDLTNSDLSAYASSSDEYENVATDDGDGDDVFQTPKSTRTLHGARRFKSSELLDEELKLFDDLSGFGARVAKFSSTDDELAARVRAPASRGIWSKKSRGRVQQQKVPRLELARRAGAISSHSLEIVVDGGQCQLEKLSDPNESGDILQISRTEALEASLSEVDKVPSKERAQLSVMTKIPRPRLSYWPLLSWSSAFSTSTTNRDASTSSTSKASEASPRTRSPKLTIGRRHQKSNSFRHQRQANEAKKVRRQLKYFIQNNLVASLIGAYILISVITIIVLMVPYLSSLLERPVRVSVETQTGADSASKIAAQRQQETVIRKMASFEGATSAAPEPDPATRLLPSINREAESAKNSNDEAASRKRQLDLMKKRLLLARVVQMRAEAKARESESFQELWRVVHKRPCAPLKIPFCSRSLVSMLPESATINSDFMATLPTDFTMTYDKTLLPNQFTMGRQSQVERVLDRYDPLVDVRCYSLMPLFLCSIFAPKCIQINATVWSQSQQLAATGASVTAARNRLHARQTDSPSDDSADKDPPDVKESVDYLDQLFPALKRRPGSSQRLANKSAGEKVQLARLVPPCRSVCREALRKCAFFLEVLSLTLFTADDCENLPESSDEKVCVGQKENLLLQRAQASMNCRQAEFRCTNGDCIPQKWHCDGFADCSDKSDEQRCSKCDLVSQFYCGHEVCINKSQVCDGRIDCRDGRDERLCLRLSSNSSSMIAQKPHLRRLEAWNATLAQWAPVCGNRWQPVPMSHEACQALGYSRANETLILFDSPTASSSRRFVRSPPLLDHSVSYEQSARGNSQVESKVESRLEAHSLEVRRELGRVDTKGIELAGGQLQSSRLEASSKLKSLASLLQMGSQFGCEPSAAASGSQAAADEQLVSTVHLSCQGFQCGRSVTSYLTRVQQQHQQQLSPIPAPPMVSSVAIATGSDASAPSLTGKGPPSASHVRSLITSSLSPVMNFTTLLESGYDQDDQGSESEESGGSLANENLHAPVSARLVVGGIESMPGEFPYLAALHGGPDEVFFCGGVLISTNWLLTAAHCVGNRSQPEGWMVKVGVTRRIASPAFVRKLQVRRIIKHHAFNVGAHLNNDIALIQLAEHVEFNQYLRPICLPPANLKLGPDNSKDCVVVGFGKSRFSQEANYLHAAHFAKVPIISQRQCAIWYAEQDVKLAEGMMCAGYSEGKRDACQGDSGSGLFCRQSDTNQFFVAGVVSFGIKCATPKLPGVYTSVPHYVDWIQRHAGNDGHLNE